MVTNVDSYAVWLERLPGKQEALLRLLGDYEYHSQHEMVECVSWRFSAVIESLRKKGFDIESHHIDGTLWEYRLISCPEV